MTRSLVEGHNIVVILGDNIFQDTFKEEIQQFEADENHNCYLFLKQVPNPHQFGIADVDENFNLINIEEKPKNPKSDWAVTGLYFYKKDIFEKIEKVKTEIGYSVRGELEITDVNNIYVKEKKAKALLVKGAWFDAGEFETLIDAGLFIRSITPKKEEFEKKLI